MKQNSLRSRRKTIYPTEAEDREIRAGIAADPDTHELTRAEIGTLRPAREVLSPKVLAQLRSGKVNVIAESDAQREKRTRMGRPPKERPKVPVTMRLDADVAEFFRATGAGWQSRIGALLAAHVKRANKAAAGSKKPRI